MQTNVNLPQLELTMDNVRVATVRVRLGDRVTAGQTLAEVETGKALVEVPSPQEGYVRKIFVKADDQIHAKDLLCILTDKSDEPVESPVPPSPNDEEVERELPKSQFQHSSGAPRHEPAPLTPSLSPAGERLSARTGEEVAHGVKARTSVSDNFLPNSLPTSPGEASSLLSTAQFEGPVKAAPAARKLAKDLGVDLAKVTGTGPDGRITIADVHKASDLSTLRVTTSDWSPLSPSRLALIAQMQKSLAEIPQFHVARQMDVGPLLVKSGGMTFTVRLIRAASLALGKHPPLRTVIADNKVRIAPVSIALAVQTPRGLVAPVVRGADSLSLEQIAAVTKDFRARAQTGTLRREELIDAPFAISNLGMFGVDFCNAFVFHGQTAVLAVGRAADGNAWFNLGADHRIVDGAEAAKFLATLQQEILRA